MKKLLIALAAAATTAIGAYADGVFQTGTAFSIEGQTLEAPVALSGATVQELTDGAGYWAGLVDDIKVTPFDGQAPAQFDRFLDADFNHLNYLAVKTTLGSPMTRYVNGDASAFDVSTAGALYFEGNVKFTAFDQAPDLTDADYAGAKIALFVQDHSEAETDAKAETNLYVAVGETVYNCGNEVVALDDWTKLTIKALEINDDHQLGFLIYVNGDPVTCANVTQPAGLNNIAASWASKNQLFPSAIATGATAKTITGISFDGQGALDQIAFTQEDLIPDPSIAEIGFGTTIAELTIYEDGEALGTFTTAPATFEYDLEKVYTYTYKAADGHIDVTTPVTLTAAQLEEEGFEIPAASECVAEVTIDETTTPYAELADALAAVKEVAAATLTLKKPVANGLVFENTVDGSEIVLDLNGQTVAQATDDEDGAAIWIKQGNLTVIGDGVVQGNEATTSAIGAATDEDGNYLGAVTVVGGVYNGVVDPDMATVEAASTAKFDKDNNSDISGEVCDLTAPTGYEFVSGEGDYADYWVLQEIQKAEVELTVTAGVGTTLTVTGSTAGEGKAKEGDVLTIEAALASGDYKDLVVKVNGEATEETQITVGKDNITIESSATAIPYVAQIGDDGEKFLTLAEAVTAADAGATIKLLADVSVAGTYAKSLTLDLNGKTATTADATITLSGANTNFKITNGNIGHKLTVAGTAAKVEIDQLAWPTDYATAVGLQFNVAATEGAFVTGCSFTGASTAQLAVNNANTQFYIYGNTFGKKANAEGRPQIQITPVRSVAIENNTFVNNTDADHGGVVGAAGPAIGIHDNYRTGSYTAPIVVNGNDFSGISYVIGIDCEDQGNTPWAVPALSFKGNTLGSATLDRGVYKASNGVLEYAADLFDRTDTLALPTGVAYCKDFAGDYYVNDAVVEFAAIKAGDVVIALPGASLESETLVFKPVTGFKNKFTVEEKPQGPTPTGDGAGSVEPVTDEPGVYVVTGDPSSGNVSIDPTSLLPTDTIRVTDSTIGKITGVPANQIQIKLNGYEIDQKYFVGGDDKGFSLELSNEAKPAFAEASEDVKPFEVGEDAAVTIKAVPGLKYALVRGDTVDAISTTVVEATVATEQTLKLEDTTPKADAAFYKVQVSK